tara:strand:- start:621 stop:770 length:150 start_codon:yes stop_codon:yes gene_type:complete
MYKMTIKKCNAKGISLKLNKECPLKLGVKIKKVINNKANCVFLCCLINL